MATKKKKTTKAKTKAAKGSLDETPTKKHGTIPPLERPSGPSKDFDLPPPPSGIAGEGAEEATGEAGEAAKESEAKTEADFETRLDMLRAELKDERERRQVSDALLANAGVTIPSEPAVMISNAIYDQARAFGMDERNADRFAAYTLDRMRAPSPEMPPNFHPDDCDFYDLRSEQDYDYPGGKNKARMVAPGVPARRDPSTVDTLIVHQTAVEYGVTQRMVDAHGGDVELARAHRALDVACHAMVFRQGYFVAAHDLDVYVNHAGRFNAPSLCLEIDGRYSGLEDDPDTVAREDLKSTWGGLPTELTEQTIETAKAAIRWLILEARERGMFITKIASHRQSSDMRRSDPGESIWREIVLPIAEELGLEVITASPWNQGRPVPVQWDPNGSGEY